MESAEGRRMMQKEEEEEDYSNLFETYFVQPLSAKTKKVPAKSPRLFNDNLIQQKRANLEEKRQKLVKKRLKFDEEIKNICDDGLTDEVEYKEIYIILERINRYKEAKKKHEEALENTEVVHEIEIPKLVSDTVTHSYVDEEVPLKRILRITSENTVMNLLLDDAVSCYTLHQDGYYTIVFCNTSNEIISYIIIKENCLI